MRLGIDRLVTEYAKEIRGRRVGLLTHAAAAMASAWPGDPVELLLGAGVDIELLFTPLHGYWSDLSRDEVRPLNVVHNGIPVISLHGEGKRPTREMLADLDVIVVNLQHVGCNAVTYVYTLAQFMEVAGELGKEMIVLDRPDPAGGLLVEGPLPVPDPFKERSRYVLPFRHGLTLGEVALFFNEEYHLGVPLTVITMEGWRRDMLWRDTGLPWIAPSPALPTAEAALVYGATVLLEGSSISVGRETHKPFERLGASWITDPRPLAEELNRRAGPAVRFRPAFYSSADGKQRFGGVELFVLRPHEFEWLETALVIISVFREFAGSRFSFRHDLLGDPEVANLIEQGRPVPEIQAVVRQKLAGWLELRRRYLLYPMEASPEREQWQKQTRGTGPRTRVGFERRPFLNLWPLELHLSPGETRELQVAVIDEEGKRRLPSLGEVGWEVDGPPGLATVEVLGDPPRAVLKAGPAGGEGALVATWRGLSVRRLLDVSPLVVTDIRVGTHPGYLRIVLDVSRGTDYRWEVEAGILRISCRGQFGGRLDPRGGEIPLADPLIQRITYGYDAEGSAVVEAYLTSPVLADTPYFGHRIVFDLTPLL